jgi:hypothetical protein
MKWLILWLVRPLRQNLLRHPRTSSVGETNLILAEPTMMDLILSAHICKISIPEMVRALRQ